MKNTSLILGLILLTLLLQGCGRIPLDTEGYVPADIPRFIAQDIVSLNQIEKISKLRSHEGHDYSDGTERNRSMKHYYQPFASVISNNQSVNVYSPVDGTIIMVQNESENGSQVRVVPRAYPYITIVLFHIITSIAPGTSVAAGQLLGTASVALRFTPFI